MRLDRMTTKAQEAVREAIDLASRKGNPELYPEHLLRAIVDQDGWVVAAAGPGVGMAIADIDLARSRDKKLTEYVDLHADRRLDLYLECPR